MSASLKTVARPARWKVLIRNGGELPLDGPNSARLAGLRYVCDDGPGIARIRCGSGFRYVDSDGRSIRDPEVQARIRALAVPPAWQEVWICADPHGHLQARGRDARGRKQYRYHARWRAVRDDTKYHRMISFAEALPRIRKRVAWDLNRPGLSRNKVLATVVQLLEKTLIRVGNGEYARTNRSYGLTTLRNGHVKVTGAKLTFEFRGKSGIVHRVGVDDRRLARIVRRCLDLPGYELFQYLDASGVRRSVDSGDVNRYLRSVIGQNFTAKDFRTWAGTVLAARFLADLGAYRSRTAAKRSLNRAIDSVADKLGNTRAVCRSSYIHPAVVDAYMDGTLAGSDWRASSDRPFSKGLRADEADVLALLRRQVRRNRAASDLTRGKVHKAA